MSDPTGRNTSSELPMLYQKEARVYDARLGLLSLRIDDSSALDTTTARPGRRDVKAALDEAVKYLRGRLTTPDQGPV